MVFSDKPGNQSQGYVRSIAPCADKIVVNDNIGISTVVSLICTDGLYRNIIR